MNPMPPLEQNRISRAELDFGLEQHPKANSIRRTQMSWGRPAVGLSA